MDGRTSDCPCEAVRELKVLVERHDTQLHNGDTNFALVQRDLEYIKEKLDRRERFNAGTVSALVNGVITLLLAAIAAKMGLG